MVLCIVVPGWLNRVISPFLYLIRHESCIGNILSYVIFVQTFQISFNTYSTYSMFYYILKMKMTSRSLLNFCFDPLASVVKFSNDRDVIFIFKM